MADPDQLAILKQGVEVWNTWRKDHPEEHVDLTDANLGGTNLQEANLSGADLLSADLSYADLSGADLSGARLNDAVLDQANLKGSDLHEAILYGADLRDAILCEAILIEARLNGANLTQADLSRADLSKAHFVETLLCDTELTAATGLDTCEHHGPSIIDYRTVAKPGSFLPPAFLRGVGLPNILIDLVPALRGDPLQFCKCFISYSSKDQAFVERLYADLQNKGVRCWFAPHDLAIGAKTRSAIDEAIREYDKLLLVLSKYSVDSAWVEHEIERALAKELRTRKVVLFPLRLDDAIMSATTTWARELREERNIGDMRRWNNYTAYQRTFERVLRDLRSEAATPTPSTEA